MATVAGDPDLDRIERVSKEGEMLQFAETVGPVPITAGWDAEPVVLDWFGEGRADLLVSFGGGPLGRYARVYPALANAERAVDGFGPGQDVPSLDGLRCLCPFPSGRPTRFDLVALSDQGLVLLRNEGTAHQPVFATRTSYGVPSDLGLGPGRVAQMVAEDWDGDGRLDLLIGFDDLDGYWPDGEDVPLAQRVGFNQLGGHPGYDRRGHWRGRKPRARLFWMRNVGTANAPHFQAPEEILLDGSTIELGNRPAPLIVAWGAPRASEVLLPDAKGLLHLHRNFGGQRPPILMDSRPLRLGDCPFALPPDRWTITSADLDGDGRSELIFGTADGRVFAIHSGKSRDSIESCEPIQHQGRTLRLGGHAVVAAADLDSDGDVDLIVGDVSGRLYRVEDLGEPGRHVYARPVELDVLGLPFRLDPGSDGMLEGPIGRPLGFACPTIADWKHNGRPDLLVSGAGGEVLFLRNNGGPREPRFDRPEAVLCDGAPLITPPRVRPATCRASDPGPPDLISLDLQGFLCLYPRVDALVVDRPRPLVDRLGRVLRLDGGFGLAGRCNLWAGSWTAPGRSDILVGIARRSRFVVPALTGGSAEGWDDLPTVLLLVDLGDGTYSPRGLHLEDGSPLIVGHEGCSPCGVDWDGRGALDLLVGSDDGRVFRYAREALRW